MNYQQKFEDEGFVYELTVQSSEENKESLHTLSQGNGFYCTWIIREKETQMLREVSVTNDDCEVIVYQTVEAAVRGAKDFLNL